MEFHREWSPNGYDRVINLFENEFYDHLVKIVVHHKSLLRMVLFYHLVVR